jgi:UDP-N-acetylmuramoyl-L-alanyl-D-glutamate--2,6-diaminopimelate ligase
MGEIATRLADFAVITSDNSRSEDPEDIIRDILAGVGDRNNYTVVVDRRKAIENTVVNAKKGDIIILAGKGHETYEINRAGRFPFNEKEIAQAAARQRFNG